MAEVFRDGIKICNAKEASNFLERAIGLMFRGSLARGEGLLIEFSSRLKSRSIHSFFMRFTIDLIFIDSDMAVVGLHTLVPWRLHDPKTDCKWVLEVNVGTIKENNIKIGEKLAFK